jgi:hypothetical protein
MYSRVGVAALAAAKLAAEPVSFALRLVNVGFCGVNVDDSSEGDKNKSKDYAMLANLDLAQVEAITEELLSAHWPLVPGRSLPKAAWGVPHSPGTLTRSALSNVQLTASLGGG